MKSNFLVTQGSSGTLREKLLTAYQTFNRKVQAMNTDLLSLYNTFARAGSGGPLNRREQITLEEGKIFTVQKRFRIQGVYLQEGSLWLTIPGESRDILLQSGETLSFGQGWPVVIEALSDSEAFLLLE